jgi:hypothetical protein
LLPKITRIFSFLNVSPTSIFADEEDAVSPLMLLVKAFLPLEEEEEDKERKPHLVERKKATLKRREESEKHM